MTSHVIDALNFLIVCSMVIDGYPSRLANVIAGDRSIRVQYAGRDAI
jgi:hypothetical protein